MFKIFPKALFKKVPSDTPFTDAWSYKNWAEFYQLVRKTWDNATT